jgi:hypothetical protein
MADGTKVEIYNDPKHIAKASEFVQLLPEDRRNLTPKEQADIRTSIVKKQHELYEHMDLTATKIDELVGFQNNLKSIEKHFGRFDLLQIFQIVDPERKSDGSVLPNIKPGSKLRAYFNGMLY